MKGELNFKGMIQKLASKSQPKGVHENKSGMRAISFAENRSTTGQGDSRLLFVPKSKLNGGGLATGASRPRAILRMVSGFC